MRRRATHSNFSLNQNVTIGGYRSSMSPSEPILVHLTRTPCKPNVGLSEHEQNKAGRAELLETSFATFEHNIREQLSRTLAGGGFDPARDIEAITVNRWPHGYAPEYNPLWDPDVPEESAAERDRPREIRQDHHREFGRRWRRLHGFRDRAGGSRGERVVEGVGVAASLWSATAAPGPVLGPLSESVRAQVAIIGAGYTGLSAALHLAEAGRDVVVLDAVDVGERASGLNGGQVIPGVKHDPDTLEEMFGPVVGLTRSWTRWHPGRMWFLI